MGVPTRSDSQCSDSVPILGPGQTIFSRRFWPDGAPTTPLPDPAVWEGLPTVSRLRSPAVAGIRIGGSIYEVGWNGTWVKAFARPAP